MASPPLEFLTGKIVSIIENEVSLIGGVRDQLDEIKRELLTMKAFLADAGKKGALSEVEKTWVENVRDVSIDIEDIIDEFTYQMNKHRSWGPYARAFRQMICFPKHLWERHRIATKLHNIIRTIRAIRERNQCYGVDRIQGIGASHNYDPNRVRIYGESSLFFKDDELVGIKDAKDKLVGWLLSEQPERSVISVAGMGGSGKTTLVANTFNSQTVKKHFDCHAWITVSQTYNIEDLLKIMIKELFRAAMEAIPLDISNMSYRGLVEMLIKYLQPKRYVIVLDDVWDRELWSHINVALPDGAHGSRVVLTTRNQDIASFSFGVRSHVYHVHPLIEKEAWDLFSMKAFSSWPDRSCPQELEHIARDLVGKCKGLPLGIVALGALMSTKRLKSEWTRFCSSLNWELSNNPTLEVVRSILLLSFNGLPYRLKRCFLYFCIFPEDYVVKCERLKRLWMAEGFVEQVRGARPEEIAESYIAELTCRCMLQVVQREPSGRAKTFKVHDLLRELALSISEAEKFCAVYHSQEANEGCKDAHRLSVRASNGEFRPHRDMSKVRTFFIFSPEMSDSSSLEKLPSGFKLLRVLDLKYLPLAQLPDDIVKCFNLRYLNLKSTKVKELPKDIGNLHNLETLNIKNSMIRSLPVGMVKLKNLRHLLMYHYPEYDVKSFNWLDSTQARFDISKLESLQVLDGIEAGGELIKQLRHMTQLTRLSLSNVRGVDEKDLCKSIESMKLIEFLGVKTSNEDEVLRLDALPTAPPLLKTLVLTGKLEKVPHWFHSLDSVIYLSLHWSRLTEDFLPYIQTLPNLTKLVLHNAHVGNQLVFHTGFQKLTELSLANNARSNIMEEAHIRIMREATSAPSKDTPWPQINVVCPGKEISNWFSYQSEGSSVNIKLRPDWFQTGLFGFALSAVVSGVSKQHCSLTANANFIGKFKGESHKLFTSEIYIKSSVWNYCYDQHHVYVWNEAFRSEEEEEECSPDSEEEEECSPDVEASVDFCLEDEDDQPISDMKVESCGICLFYAEDAKKFKFDHVFMLREPKVEEETRQDDDSKGGQFPQIEEETREDDNSKGRQSRDEPEASGSSDESEAN